MNLVTLLQMASDGFGDRVALGSWREGVTFAALRDRAARGAAHLRRTGAAQLVFVANDRSFPVAIFAGAWAGVPVVPLNYRLGQRQLQELVGAQGSDAVVVADERSRPRVEEAAPELLTCTEWWELTTPAPREGTAPPREASPDGAAVVLYTSGTTSAPKAAVLRHDHLTSYVLGSVEFGAAVAGDAALLSVPPYHIAGVANVLTNVYRGRRIVQLPQFDAAEWLATVRRESVTHALVVPTMLARIVDELEAAGTTGPPGLRSLAYGGAPMPRSVIERALRLLPATDFVNAYGLTETSSTIAVLGPDDHRLALHADDEDVRARLSSAGRLLPGVEAQVRDDRGRPLPTGGSGRLYVRGPQVSGEYRDHGSALDEDGWFATGDRGYLDEEGYLFVEGRQDDTIIRGGENIAPPEIEEVFRSHPDVRDAGVVGVPDEEWGQRLEAVVVPADGASPDPEALRTFADDRLRSSRSPDAVAVWEELPRTETGKLLRRRILERLRTPEG